MPSSINQPTNVLSQPVKTKMSFQSIARGSCTENCALERPFPEERVRPSFPARPKSGLISIALWQFALAGYLAHRSEVAAGAHRSCSSHCPSETQWMLGVTAKKTPLLSWHSQASSFLGNSRHRLRCELQSAYPPKMCQWDWPVPSHGEPPRKGGTLRKIPSRYSPRRSTEHKGLSCK